MLLKHNLRIAAQEMNIVLGVHLALVSIPMLVEAGYTTAAVESNNFNGSGTEMMQKQICAAHGLTIQDLLGKS